MPDDIKPSYPSLHLCWVPPFSWWITCSDQDQLQGAIGYSLGGDYALGEITKSQNAYHIVAISRGELCGLSGPQLAHLNMETK